MQWMSWQGWVCSVGLVLGLAGAMRADEYALDESHTAFDFEVSHLGISRTTGRFNEVTGSFSHDAAAPDKSAFTLTIKAESIDTNSKKRDEHLRSPDFFNVKQFPTLTFQSKTVKHGSEGLAVTGELTMHGVTKPVSFVLKGGKTAEFPPGVHRIGFSTDFTIKRSDFGMDKMVGPVGDEVEVEVSFEGVKKKK